MRAAVIAAVLAMAASPALAQEAGDDWDLTIDETQQMMLATVGYSSGQAIAVRCRAGELDVLVTGLPALLERGRYVEMDFGGRRRESGHWFNSEDGTLIFSAAPAPVARRLRTGGPLQLSVAVQPEPESPLRRYALDLPARSANLDRVIEGCGTPLTDPRDDLPRWNHPRVFPTAMWREQPTPEFPGGALHSRVNAGFAVLSCIVGEGGRLSDCRIERESDRRAGFGESAVRSMRAARLSLSEPGAPEVGQLLFLTIRFQIAS
ncbi:hypothetical protein [Brevundimonas sp.]|uniref:hypothetical protein n=1 Tax=Brevundimonas sp. TaxID=1871086 RepID=UPI002EDB4332